MMEGLDAAARALPEQDEAPVFTPGPWEYVPSSEHHGPYVTSDFGSTICDLYVMSETGPFISTSRPIHFLHEMADPNARLIAAAPELLESLRSVLAALVMLKGDEWETVKRANAAIAKATVGARAAATPTKEI